MEKKWCSFKEVVLLAGTWRLCAPAHLYRESCLGETTEIRREVCVWSLPFLGSWPNSRLSSLVVVGQVREGEPEQLLLSCFVLGRAVLTSARGQALPLWSCVTEEALLEDAGGERNWVWGGWGSWLSFLLGCCSPVWSLVAQGMQKHCFPKWICLMLRRTGLRGHKMAIAEQTCDASLQSLMEMSAALLELQMPIK